MDDEFGADGPSLTEITPSINREEVRSSRYNDGESLSGCGGTILCDPRRPYHRFVVLIFMCLLTFGSYFCYDNPGALQTHIKQDMKVNSATFMALYSWYSWPNVVLCFFGGFLIDRVFGIRLGASIFAAIITVGQIIFASGALVNAFWLMELGRFIFGIGGESLAVAQNTYAVSWFIGKELNMVFGLQLSFSRVGSTVNFNVMEPLYNAVSKIYKGYECLGIVLMVGALLCLFSLICSLILGCFDNRAARILKRKSGETGEVVKLTDVKDFPITFWLISIICVAYYVAIFPFTGLGTVFFQRKFLFTPSNANTVNSLIYIISAIVSPFLGFSIDKTGRNIVWVFIAVCITITSHSLLAFTFLNPYYAMSIMGVSYSLLASALWPMVALIIPEHQLGTAYGVMQSVQNLGLAVISLIVGVIVDSQGYLILEVFFLACLCISLIAVILLWAFDLANDGLLNLSIEGRHKRAAEMEIAEALERERLLASGSMADITPHDLLLPRSEFHIRNRYLSRIGVQLPNHYNISTNAILNRRGLK